MNVYCLRCNMILPRDTEQHVNSRNEFAVVITTVHSSQLVFVANQLRGKLSGLPHCSRFAKCHSTRKHSPQSTVIKSKVNFF